MARHRRGELTTAGVAGAAYAIGGIPWSQIVATRRAGVDLRAVGSGTVSGTGAYRAGGMAALLTAGLLDVGKGITSGVLARRACPDSPAARALAAGAVVTGHNWSPYLGLAGGRGIAPALGALAVQAPEGALLLLAGLGAGRAARQTGVGALAAYLALVPMLARRRGRDGALLGAAVVGPMLVKRLAGNGRPSGGGAEVWLWRLLLDRDTVAAP